MVLCRYFLQGNCRYGGNCRFEHSVPNYNSNINLAQLQQLQSHRQQQQGQLSSNDFFELVQHDLESGERSGQWLLSCYCPYPSKSVALPGLDDHSPEELRCLMYEAQSRGNVESCQQHIQKLYQDARVKRNIFKSQSPECKAILERVRSGPASPSSNLFQTNTTSGSIFGGASVEASPVKPNIFGGSPAPSASVFGGGSVVQGQSQVQVQAQANPFGAATASHPQPSIFGGGNAATNVNPFMGQSSIFGGGAASAPAQTSSIFGGAYSGQPSIFGVQPGASSVGTANAFGGGSSTMNSFSFAAAAQDQGLMSPTPAPSVPTPTMESIFGGGAQPPVQAVTVSPTVAPVANPFGAPTQPLKTVAPQVDMGAHTSLNDLTEEEKTEFMAPTFSRGRIPLRPPPAQLCA